MAYCLIKIKRLSIKIVCNLEYINCSIVKEEILFTLAGYFMHDSLLFSVCIFFNGCIHAQDISNDHWTNSLINAVLLFCRHRLNSNVILFKTNILLSFSLSIKEHNTAKIV